MMITPTPLTKVYYDYALNNEEVLKSLMDNVSFGYTLEDLKNKRSQVLKSIVDEKDKELIKNFKFYKVTIVIQEIPLGEENA